MKIITTDLINTLIAQAGKQPRQRSHHNVHNTPDDPVQRLFVAARRDSYFRPHRHPAKWEFAVVLRGKFDIILLDDNGRVTERLAAGPGTNAIGFELPANAWHTWVPLADDSVFLEVKQGPYDPKTAAEFAAWAPAEGAADVGLYINKLKHAKVGDHVAHPPAT